MSSPNTHAVDIGPIDNIASGTATRIEIDGTAIAVVRIDDDVYAIGDTCSHAKVSLSDGEVWCAERELECPRHGSTFSLLTGQPDTPPATQPVPVFGASIVNGNVVITIEASGDAATGDLATGHPATDGGATDNTGDTR